MDYRIFHAVDEFSVDHKWLAVYHLTAARFGRPLLLRLAIVFERISDPLVAPFHRRWRRLFASR